MEITAFAPPAEAHARIAYALTEVRKYLIPDSNDEIRQEQMREMEILAANGDNITAAAAMAAASAAAVKSADPSKLGSGPAGPVTATTMTPASILAAAPNLAMMHPAFRPPNLALASNPASIQSQAAAAAAMLRGIAPPTVSAASGCPTAGGPVISAASILRSHQNGQLMTASPYIAAAPMIHKMVGAPQGMGPAGTSVVAAAQQQKLYNEEMMLEAQAVSQAPSDLSKDDG